MALVRVVPKRAVVAVMTVALGMLLPTVWSASAPAPAAAEDASCVRHELAVRLVEGDPQRHRLVGWLCATGALDGQTVIVTSPPALATHAYWDWPHDPQAYSFVADAVAAGYAVFNYDRIGLGESARPEAALVTLQSGAHVLHEIVGMLRDGAIGGTAFGKVVLLGNSFGTLISIYEAEVYQDVDGLINTGVFVGPKPIGLATMFSTFYPAQLDPKFADQDIPLGYATSLPDSRGVFYHLPAAEAATLALDEQLKDTATGGEAATFGTWSATTRLVDVPVLSVMGDHDLLFCDPTCAPGGAEQARETLFWGPETCLEIEIIADAGHFIQLHRAAASTFGSLAVDWLDRRLGTDGGPSGSQPCTAET